MQAAHKNVVAVQSHFIAFNDIKSKHLSDALRTLSPLRYQLHRSISSRSRTGQDPHLIRAQVL